MIKLFCFPPGGFPYEEGGVLFFATSSTTSISRSISNLLVIGITNEQF